MRLARLMALLVCAIILAALPLNSLQAQTGSGAATVTLIGLADYHSQAVPFYSEGQDNQAGVARTVAYLKTQRQNNKNLLVFSGGDTVNLGTPTWSDEYKCVEWPWFNGLIDVMALGNHEFDYGPEDFKSCQSKIQYPIISGNFVDPTSRRPLLTVNDKPYVIKEVNGVKLGIFALAGSDFESLVKKELRPNGGIFIDRIGVAQQIVSDLRDKEKVNAVVYIGHSSREDDTEMAQKVSGIDIVMGSHSHYKGELTKLPNTNTWFISPFQYLTYLSQAELSFQGGQLTGVKGQLVKMDAAKPQDAQLSTQVAQLQKDLEAKRPERFKVLGQAGVEFSDANISTDETVLGNWSMDVVRRAAGTQAFFSTSSSFRASIPPGPITVEKFFTAIPYKNSIVTSNMTGAQLEELLNLSVSKRNSDTFSQASGVRFRIEGGKATNIQVVADSAAPTPSYQPLDPAKTYKVGTTNFQALIAPGYKDLFAKAANVTDTKQDIGTLLTDTITASSPIRASLDGRMGTALAQGGSPTTGIAPGAGVPAAGLGYAARTGSSDDNLWLLVILAIVMQIALFGVILAKVQPRRRARRK